MSAMVEMPKYKCHKEVWALKIKNAVTEDSGETTLFFEEDGYAPIKVSAEWMHKRNGKPGGYYVVYSDGYTSWSPTDAFEEGYKRI